MTTLFIVIPVYNRKKFTKTCLDSLKDQTFKDFKIIVIDDGSEDGTYQMLVNEYPNVIILKGGGNLWWAGATNLGVKYALSEGAEYILTLNNDTVVTPDMFEKLVSAAKINPGSLIGAYAIDAETKKPVYGGEYINWKSAKYNSLLDIIPENERKGLHEVDVFPGRGLLVPAAVYKKIGMYDEKHFPQYAADYDFTHRAIKAGFKIFIDYDAVLYMYFAASGDAVIRSNKTLKNYLLHLFGRKGGGNLKVFTIYALRNCPPKYLLMFLPLGLMRRIAGYPIEFIKESYEKKKSRR